VEHEELALAPARSGFGIDAAQQIGIALGIEHDHHLAAADVLGDQQLGQPRLADPGGAQHQRVPDPLARSIQISSRRARRRRRRLARSRSVLSPAAYCTRLTDVGK
jgi:hypothetical protein